VQRYTAVTSNAVVKSSTLNAEVEVIITGKLLWLG
jgi:hypothetical protein